jgi:phosphoribosyl 1,2-cyclic phosphodiesterase
MLEKGSYPFPLKQRIRSDEGHLSNDQALELFRNYKSGNLRLLILSHLSKNNNRVELVEDLFTREAGDTQIFVASRYRASPVFCIDAGRPGAVTKTTKRTGRHENQLSLF